MKVGLFPGQGIPARIVLSALPADDPLVGQAGEILGFDLRQRVESVAQRQRSVLPTWLAQPAIFTASLASWHATEPHSCSVLMGHSVGEFAALTASDAITFEQGLRAVQVRGEVMHAIASRSRGGMVAILDLTIDECRDLAETSGASVANDNSPSQVVLSGDDQAIAVAAEKAKERGGRAVRLEVTGPFHTEAMVDAIPKLREALDHVLIRSPRIPVISNVTARPYRAPGEIRSLLLEQLVAPVRFREALTFLWERGIRDTHDFGPGRVVAGLAGKTFAALSEDAAAVAS